MTPEREQVIACFARLRAMPVCVERFYIFGSDRVRVRYLDAHLASLLHPAVAHLESGVQSGEADLLIHVFAATEPPLQLTREAWVESSKRWKTKTFDRDRVFTHFLPGDDGRLDVLLGAQREAFTCFRDPRHIPAWDVATPFRDLLQGWNRLQGGHVIHGGVVADDRNAILLAGAGGAGKSSTALACLLQSDLFFLGDDLCLVRRDARDITVYSLYNSTKLLPHDVPRFGDGLAPYDDSSRGDGKPTFYAFPKFRDRLTTIRPLKAILLLQVHDSPETRLQAARAGDAWKAVGPSTLALVPSDASGFQWLADLVSDLPAWHLLLGARRELIPPAIKQVLLKFTNEHAVVSA
jgi:hypothetical protein